MAPALLPHFRGPQAMLGGPPSLHRQLDLGKARLPLMNGSSPAAHPSSCLKPFFSAGKDQNAPAWPPVDTVGSCRGQRVGGPKQPGEAGAALGGTPPGSTLITPQDEENCQRNARCGRGGRAEGKGWGEQEEQEERKERKQKRGRGEKAVEENKEGWGVAWDGEGEEESRGGERNHKTLGPFTVCSG